MKFALHNEKALPDAFARRGFLRHIRFHDTAALRAIRAVHFSAIRMRPTQDLQPDSAAVRPRLHGALRNAEGGAISRVCHSSALKPTRG